MNKQRKIVDLMSRYFELQDQIAPLLAERDEVRTKLFKITNPGKYGVGTVYSVGEKWIHVNPYERRAFKAIRRSKNQHNAA